MTGHIPVARIGRLGTAFAMAGCIAISVGTAYANARHAVWAHATHVLSASDTAHLHYVSASGSLLFEEGKATGTLPGKMQAHMDLGTTFSGTFTIVAGDGTIKGHGSAKPYGSGTYESFTGTLVVTSGTGRYAGAHGRGSMTGTFDRDDYALVIKTAGTLTY